MGIVVRKKLPLILSERFPSFIEKLFLGIVCVGLCVDKSKPENVKACRIGCIEPALEKLYLKKLPK